MACTANPEQNDEGGFLASEVTYTLNSSPSEAPCTEQDRDSPVQTWTRNTGKG